MDLRTTPRHSEGAEATANRPARSRGSVVMTVLWLTLLLIVAGALATLLADGRELTPLTPHFETRGFELIAVEDRVRVYKNNESEIIHLAAEGRVAAPPKMVRQALLAYEIQPSVIKRLSESRILSRSRNRMLVYQRLNLPIVDDRDYTLWVSWGERGEVQWIRYRLAKHHGPAERKGVVRVPHHRGIWQLRPIHGGRATLLRYEVSIDLAGLLPRRMVKSAAGNEVPGAYRDICRVLEVLGNQPQQCLL